MSWNKGGYGEPVFAHPSVRSWRRGGYGSFLRPMHVSLIFETDHSGSVEASRASIFVPQCSIGHRCCVALRKQPGWFARADIWTNQMGMSMAPTQEMFSSRTLRAHRLDCLQSCDIAHKESERVYSSMQYWRIGSAMVGERNGSG